MDKWRITGAEAATGAEKSIEVNARDEGGAREAARMLGMLVVGVARLDAPVGPVLDYRRPGETNSGGTVGVAVPVEAAGPAVEFGGIVRGAASVAAAARVVFGVGVAALLLAGVGVVGAGVMAVAAEGRGAAVWVLVGGVLGGVLGVVMLAMASALQLMAAVGLAVREIAKGASKREEDAGCKQPDATQDLG